MKRIGVPLLVVLCILLLAGSSHAQSVINGMVADSATMLPIPNVSVRVKSGSITISNSRGYFSINASDYDTLVFSSVGYETQAIIAKQVKDGAIVFLAEQQTTLKTVEVTSDNILPPYVKTGPLDYSWQNTTQSKSFMEMPGFQGLQTFGPGYVFNGPISKFSKPEREQKKLDEVTEENYRAQQYIAIVTAPEVKGRIMHEYNLTETQYNELLAVFNEKNRDIIYQLDENELISMLLTFYEESTAKK